MIDVNPWRSRPANVCSGCMSIEKQNTQGTPGENEEADTASGGAPETPDTDG